MTGGLTIYDQEVKLQHRKGEERGNPGGVHLDLKIGSTLYM